MRLSLPALALAFLLLAPACGGSSPETIALERLAAQGDKREQFKLGVKYSTGTGGAPLDHVKAVEWYLRAAKQGVVEAQFNLGLIYKKGEKGVPQDYAKADQWFLKAAEQGNEKAKLNLTLIYTGLMIEALKAGDDRKAKEWSAKAQEAQKKLDAMDERRKQKPA